MRDILILGFMLFMIIAAFQRPFMMTLAYMYVDMVQPQRITYYLLNAAPTSLIMAALAILFFIAVDDKRGMRFGRVQALMLILLIWVTITTFTALIPEPAWVKWDSAWKAIGFGIFLPFVLRTRQRLEGGVLVVVLSIGAITITGGIKTILGGGGYGSMSLLVDNNSGLYESSTISAVSIAIIPLIMWLYKYNTLLGRSAILKLVTVGLVFSSLLIPIGTEARTGLVCIVVLAAFVFLRSNRKIVVSFISVIMLALITPILPSSFTDRMKTIESHDEDQSASSRIVVWAWTWKFVQSHPLGGGFGCYRLNTLEIEIKRPSPDGGKIETIRVKDQARAFHSSYFEVLGEHGYPGIIIYLAMLATALAQTFGLYRKYRVRGEDERWIAEFALASNQAVIIYMVGSIFAGIAFLTINYILLAFGVSIAHIAQNREASLKTRPVLARQMLTS